MIYKIRNFFKFLTILTKVKDLAFAKMLASYSGNNYKTLGEYKFEFKHKKLVAKDLGLELEQRFLPLFRSNLALLIKFNKHFSFDESGENLIVTFNKTGLRFHAKSYENIYALNEIFIDEVYDVSLAPGTVVLDIGMNVGSASLCFAANPNVAQVYGFEPFNATYQQALLNIALNPSFAKNIIALNAGVGKGRTTLSLPSVNEGFLGASTSDFMTGVSQSKNAAQVEQIAIEDISDILNNIISKHPGSEIYIKMDCEGAEYDIFERLIETNMTTIPAGYSIEWHIKGKEAILKALGSHYNYTATMRDVGFDMGLIYAFKK